MTDLTTSHHTVVVRRAYHAPVADVFRAWTDSDALKRWHMPGDDTWTSEILEHDFRVDGRRLFFFGPPGVPPYGEDCRYEDIVPERRVCYAMTISNEGIRITTSMVTVEFIPRGDKTEPGCDRSAGHSRRRRHRGRSSARLGRDTGQTDAVPADQARGGSAARSELKEKQTR